GGATAEGGGAVRRYGGTIRRDVIGARYPIQVAGFPTYRHTAVPPYRRHHVSWGDPSLPHSRKPVERPDPLRAAAVVHPERRLPARERDLAHGDPDPVRTGNVDLGRIG